MYTWRVYSTVQYSTVQYSTVQQLVHLQGGFVVGEGVEAGVVQHERVVAVLQKVEGAVGDVDSEENLGINVCACFMFYGSIYSLPGV